MFTELLNNLCDIKRYVETRNPNTGEVEKNTLSDIATNVPCRLNDSSQSINRIDPVVYDSNIKTLYIDYRTDVLQNDVVEVNNNSYLVNSIRNMGAKNEALALELEVLDK